MIINLKKYDFYQFLQFFVLLLSITQMQIYQKNKFFYVFKEISISY